MYPGSSQYKSIIFKNQDSDFDRSDRTWAKLGWRVRFWERNETILAKEEWDNNTGIRKKGETVLR